MTEKELKKLSLGDIVKSKLTGKAYIVTDNNGSRVIAIRTMEISNPIEWDIYKVAVNSINNSIKE